LNLIFLIAFLQFLFPQPKNHSRGYDFSNTVCRIRGKQSDQITGEYFLCDMDMGYYQVLYFPCQKVLCFTTVHSYKHMNSSYSCFRALWGSCQLVTDLIVTRQTVLMLRQFAMSLTSP